MPDFIRYDLFPAAVVRESDGQRWEPSRAIVTDDTVYVYMDSSSGPVVAYEGKLDDFTPKRNLPSEATVDGDTISITRAGGCGCGSRLRGLVPFPGVPLAAQNYV